MEWYFNWVENKVWQANYLSALNRIRGGIYDKIVGSKGVTNIFVNTIVFVSDLQKSKLFYAEVLKIKVKKELENIVFFENQLVLHSAAEILNTVFNEDGLNGDLVQGRKNILLYFESDNLIKLFNDLQDKVRIIHNIKEQKWGQKVFRFYDPDDHIVEFGEPYPWQLIKQYVEEFKINSVWCIEYSDCS